jgi:hypothetical protein
MYSRSTGQRTSLAVRTLISESSAISTTASEAIPPLTRGNSDASSAGSADTGLASALDGMNLLESHDGILGVPDRYLPEADLICPFQILDCEESFSDIRLFKTHVFSHFRGQPCPTCANCFLCESKFAQNDQDDVARAWNEMLSHLANDHFRRGQRLGTVRVDFGLMRWMYARRIVTDAQFKRLQLCPRPTIIPAFPGARDGEVVNAPQAPMAPPSMLPRIQRRSRPLPTTGTGGRTDEPFTVQAGRRADRRSRTMRRPPG